MLFKQMRYYVTVVECNNFTEAAERCYISQSAISQQINALEKDLGVTLIHREKRSFSLTPAGEYFYRHSRELLEEMEALRKETVRIGEENESQLKIGYLRAYGGQELHYAVAEFSAIYPDVAIDIAGGTHEELYDLIRSGGVDLVLSDQRRAFSDDYINFHLLYCNCFIEISSRHPLSSLERITLDQLKRIPCIMVSSKEQQEIEQDYYQNTLGFGGNFLFAESLEEARLMAVGNRGFLPVEDVGSLPPPGPAIRRLPLYSGERQIQRNYCAFWRKERSGYYIEEFAGILRKQFPEDTAQ